MSKPRLATVWLGGCSGCHMSFLDLDEALFTLAERVDVVFTPIADVKAFPHDVDITLVEGAVANTDNLEMAHDLRAKSNVVVSLGDCAVTGNVTALRNLDGQPDAMLRRVYVDGADLDGRVPASPVLPVLLPQVRPLHQVITVDRFVPGCPPGPALILAVIDELLTGAPAPDPHIPFG